MRTRKRTEIWVYNEHLGEAHESAFQDEWQVSVFARDFMDTHIWFLVEV